MFLSVFLANLSVNISSRECTMVEIYDVIDSIICIVCVFCLLTGVKTFYEYQSWQLTHWETELYIHFLQEGKWLKQSCRVYRSRQKCVFAYNVEHSLVYCQPPCSVFIGRQKYFLFSLLASLKTILFTEDHSLYWQA